MNTGNASKVVSGLDRTGGLWPMGGPTVCSILFQLKHSMVARAKQEHPMAKSYPGLLLFYKERKLYLT